MCQRSRGFIEGLLLEEVKTLFRDPRTHLHNRPHIAAHDLAPINAVSEFDRRSLIVREELHVTATVRRLPAPVARWVRDSALLQDTLISNMEYVLTGR